MKIMYRGLYFYLGWNGIIIAFDFDFRGKSYSIDATLFASRFDLDDAYPEHEETK